VFAAFGCHPLAAAEWDEAMAARVRRLVSSNPKVVAVGECGLDYHYESEPAAREAQWVVFVAQMTLAAGAYTRSLLSST
jgi:TatD DNase family protein